MQDSYTFGANLTASQRKLLVNQAKLKGPEAHAAAKRRVAELKLTRTERVCWSHKFCGETLDGHEHLVRAEVAK